jgi:hypothetical protein
LKTFARRASFSGAHLGFMEDDIVAANDALERAIAFVGGETPLAAICKVGPAVICRARKDGKVPTKVGVRMAFCLGYSLPELLPQFFEDDGSVEGEACVD